MKSMFRSIKLSVSISAALTMIVALTLTALVFGSVRRAETRAQAVRFHEEAGLRINLVEDGLADAVEQLLVLKQLFNTVDGVSRDQFASFTAPLLVRYPAIQALTFQRFVLDRDRTRYETGMRKTVPGFQITELAEGRPRPAGTRGSYNVVEYVAPFDRNAGALGLDMESIALQAEARARTRLTGEIAATGMMPLLEDEHRHTGFLVLAPLYERRPASKTGAVGRPAAVGEIAAVFRIDRLAQTLLGRHRLLNTPGMMVSLHSAAAGQPSQLILRDAVQPSRMPSTLIPAWLLYDYAAPERAAFNVAGNPWRMEVAMTPSLFTVKQNGSLYVLLGGLFSSLLATAYVFSLVSRKSIIERLTSERTSVLTTDNLRLSDGLAQRIRSQQSLRLREKIIEVSANAIIICSAEGPEYAIAYVNPAFESITGYASEEVVGKGLAALQDNSQPFGNLAQINAALQQKREGHAVLRNHRKDGTGYWNNVFISPLRDDDGAIDNFVVIQSDISAVMQFEAELDYQAHHDGLTGLANRRQLRERLEHAIGCSQQGGAELWVVFIDLDRFKFVNDTLGHDAGDALLKALAERIKLAVRKSDTLARIGGDEFMLILPTGDERAASLAVIQDIMAAVAEPIMIQSYEFHLTCSVGIAVYPDDGTTVETLAKHADIAMYKAKESGRNCWQFYTAAMSARTLERLQLEADLYHALERDEFILYYQPQVDLRSGAIVGMEVLLRWNRPGHGMVGPADFISLAEDMGLIAPIGDWVLRAACRQTVAWHKAGLGDLRVAVNLSARQFTQQGLAQSIVAILDEAGLAGRFLEVELTESSVMNDVEHAIVVLRELKQIGVHIAIDDFGTGHSSLSYLRRFPIDVLKIDQSFVHEITLDEDGATLVRTIISLAHSLRLTVTAEGVETNVQRAYLREHGCDHIQGYLVSRPVARDEFEALVRKERRGIGSRGEIATV
jgi:diguanylate cyclase (GGDEF)-like protein/PAS domain S-box-containing protein